MKVLIQPGDGVAPIVKAINAARESVEVLIFRFDQREIERALANAVHRGVAVHALIAHTNRAGEENLRKLETRLLGYGVTVARTADDLVRYHGKMMIVDRRELHLLAFNMTYLDIERSRSFGVITRSRDLVREAVKLFEADVKRHPYEPESPKFLVSPVNARRELASFLKGAHHQILIYDPEVSDPEMVGILEARAKAGVDVRVIGKLTRKSRLESRRLGIRLHTRTIIRDRNAVFLGSQSLRELELDERREVGILFREPKTVATILRIFEEDWEKQTQPAAAPPRARKLAKKVAKKVVETMPPVAQVVSQVAKELGAAQDLPVDVAHVEEAVRDAVKQAVKEAVKGAVEGAAAEVGGRPDAA